MSHAELLAAIHANLADDAPRLVYADALQAEGDPRGEFIAVQCELARLGLGWRANAWIGDLVADADPDRVAKLRKREAKLLDEHGERWAADLAGLSWRKGHRFARGFVEHVDVWPEADQLERLFAKASTLRSLGLQLKSDGSAAHPLAETAQLRQIERISIGWSDDDVVQAVITSPQLANVRALVFDNDKLTDRTVTAFRGAAWFQALEVLEVQMYSGEAVMELIEATRSLVELRVVFDEDGDALESASQLAALEVLELIASDPIPLNLAALVDSSTKLRALRLAETAIGAAGARAIGSGLPELRVLDLFHVPIATEGWRALAHGRGLQYLRDLRLEKTTLDGDELIRALVDSSLLSRLRSLGLRDNHISDAGLEALAASEACASLLALDVTKNARLTRRGLDALDASPHLQKCRVTKPRVKR